MAPQRHVLVWSVAVMACSFQWLPATVESFTPTAVWASRHTAAACDVVALPFVLCAKSEFENKQEIEEDYDENVHHRHDATSTSTFKSTSTATATSTRRNALTRCLSSVAVAASTAASFAPPSTANANSSADADKQRNLSDQDFLKIAVDQDLVANQFLVNGRLTRSIYDESCTFQDEIDTYGLDQWQKGTAKLFDGDRSRVVLVPGSTQFSNSNSNSNGNNSVLEFRFVEYLCFNIPFVKPIVYLSGTLYLTRSPETGLVTAYRERWDQDIYKVLTSESKLFTSGLSKESLDRDLEVFFEANANKK